MTVVFVTSESDRLGKLSLAYLAGLGGMTCVLEEGVLAPEGSIPLCSCPGNYPNRYLRKIRLPHDTENRRFVLPEWTAHVQARLLLTPTSDQFILGLAPNLDLRPRYRYEHFCDALEQRYRELVPSSSKPKVHRPPEQWRSRHIAKRRQNMDELFGC